MTDPLAASYDEVPYSSKPFAPTHPDNLACVAALLGLSPPGVETCRVLEIGCGEGGNIISMAVALPRASFVGIDLSPRQIATAEALSRAVGALNTRWEAISLVDFDRGSGPFDYIICHGVYSWVPGEVQEALLSLLKRHLSENGVAFLSFNTYPGWHLRGMLRDMMRYHTRHGRSADEHVRLAREFVEALAHDLPDADGIYGRFIRMEAEHLREQPDHYLYHEYLELENHPLYFHEMADRLARHGLAHLAEATLEPEEGDGLSEEAIARLNRQSVDRIDRAQRMDFLKRRAFRQLLVVHDHMKTGDVPLPERVADLWLASTVQYERTGAGTPGAVPDGAVEFRAATGKAFTTDHPLLKAALVHLGRSWPAPQRIDQLSQGIRDLGLHDGVDESTLCRAMLECFQYGFIDLHAFPPPGTGRPGARPVASPLAREQARRGSNLLVNLRHRLVEVRDVERMVVQHLNGRHDRQALIGILTSTLASGQAVLSHKGAAPQPAELEAVIPGLLDESMRVLAAGAFLME